MHVLRHITGRTNHKFIENWFSVLRILISLEIRLVNLSLSTLHSYLFHFLTLCLLNFKRALIRPLLPNQG